MPILRLATIKIHKEKTHGQVPLSTIKDLFTSLVVIYVCVIFAQQHKFTQTLAMLLVSKIVHVNNKTYFATCNSVSSFTMCITIYNITSQYIIKQVNQLEVNSVAPRQTPQFLFTVRSDGETNHAFKQHYIAIYMNSIVYYWLLSNVEESLQKWEFGTVLIWKENIHLVSIPHFHEPLILVTSDRANNNQNIETHFYHLRDRTNGVALELGSYVLGKISIGKIDHVLVYIDNGNYYMCAQIGKWVYVFKLGSQEQVMIYSKWQPSSSHFKCLKYTVHVDQVVNGHMSSKMIHPSIGMPILSGEYYYVKDKNAIHSYNRVGDLIFYYGLNNLGSFHHVLVSELANAHVLVGIHEYKNTVQFIVKPIWRTLFCQDRKWYAGNVVIE
jgi:hypothetical protein